MNGILSRNSLYFWCLVPKNGKNCCQFRHRNQWNFMSIDFSFFIKLFFTTPSAVVLLVFIGVCPISSSAWRSGMASLQFMYRAPSSDSAD